MLKKAKIRYFYEFAKSCFEGRKIKTLRGNFSWQTVGTKDESKKLIAGR